MNSAKLTPAPLKDTGHASRVQLSSIKQVAARLSISTWTEAPMQRPVVA